MKINLLGQFANIDEVWEKYPEGGIEGDYVIVGSTEIEWNKYTQNWGDDNPMASAPRPSQTFEGDVDILGDLRVGGELYADTLQKYATRHALTEVEEKIMSDEQLLAFLTENGYKPASNSGSDSGGNSGGEDAGGDGEGSGDETTPDEGDQTPVMEKVLVDNETIIKKADDEGNAVLALNTNNPTAYIPVDGVTIIYDEDNGCFKAIGGSSGGGDGEGSGEGGGGGITTEQLTSILSSYAKKTDALKNPYALTWSGNSSGSYDGSGTANIKIPTSLPASDVSAWAKKSTKPTYTASEVGALSEDGGTIDGDLAITGDLAIAGHITSLSTSDERLKQNIRKFSATEILESMGGVYEYEYTAEEVEKNPHNAGTHRGFIYQNVAKSQMADMAIKREDGYGALNYLHPDYLALLAAANLELMKRVETLEKLLKEKSA